MPGSLQSISLHTSVAFASAGFSCAMHLSRGLYGNALDQGSCVTSLALAALTGVMRVAGDQHYLSDVLFGAVVGFVIGHLVPVLLVPERPHAVLGHAPGPSAAIVPMVAPAPGGGTYGLSFTGRF